MNTVKRVIKWIAILLVVSASAWVAVVSWRSSQEAAERERRHAETQRGRAWRTYIEEIRNQACEGVQVNTIDEMFRAFYPDLEIGSEDAQRYGGHERNMHIIARGRTNPDTNSATIRLELENPTPEPLTVHLTCTALVGERMRLGGRSFNWERRTLNPDRQPIEVSLAPNGTAITELVSPELEEVHYRSTDNIVYMYWPSVQCVASPVGFDIRALAHNADGTRNQTCMEAQNMPYSPPDNWEPGN